MYLLNEDTTPECTALPPARLESRSPELADLFRGLPLIVATDPESPDASTSVSFEALTRSEQLLTAYFSASRWAFASWTPTSATSRSTTRWRR